ncbi:MAG TPA: hypothetical protein VKB38_16310 [Terracidiphilus sp.]|nr:hypothetical protein [Terracidiphilus sp.]
MKPNLHRSGSIGTRRLTLLVSAIVVFAPAVAGFSQAPPPPDFQGQVRRLNEAVDRVQSQIEQSQRELTELRRQLSELQGAAQTPPSSDPPQSAGADAVELAAAVAGMRDTQSMHETQIATLEQTKVESESKYPVTLSGMILMTGFVNTQGVDVPEFPTVALGGPGTTGATIRQTILGIDARGPHLFGASSHADVRMDFAAGSASAEYSGGAALGQIRMRTAHGELNWEHTKAFFSLDRALLNPDTPTSLTAVATPALGWSGNLAIWTPQAGMSSDLFADHAARVRVQAALINVGDPPSPHAAQPAVANAATTTAELSRWPGVEARVALVHPEDDLETHLGISGYFAPHRIPPSTTFDSWAGALDFGFPVSRYTSIAGNVYHGQALGGLGGGAFKDYVVKIAYNEPYIRALDDTGGWLQWKQRAGERFEFNEAFGIDDVPAYQVRTYNAPSYPSYYNLARNRTLTANVIYSPSTYLLFSLEYRRIASSFFNSPTEFSDIIGLAAGYRF